MERLATAKAAALCGLALLPLSASFAAEGDDLPTKPVFEAPVRIEAGGQHAATERPGYAAPAWHDVTGDGQPDLVVGQFAGGKMRIYPGKKDGTFGEGQWLQAGGDVAEVPGVW